MDECELLLPVYEPLIHLSPSALEQPCDSRNKSLEHYSLLKKHMERTFIWLFHRRPRWYGKVPPPPPPLQLQLQSRTRARSQMQMQSKTKAKTKTKMHMQMQVQVQVQVEMQTRTRMIARARAKAKEAERWERGRGHGQALEAINESSTKQTTGGKGKLSRFLCAKDNSPPALPSIQESAAATRNQLLGKRNSCPTTRLLKLRRAGNSQTLLVNLLGIIDSLGNFIIPMHESYIENLDTLLQLSFLQKYVHQRKLNEYARSLVESLRMSAFGS